MKRIADPSAISISTLIALGLVGILGPFGTDIYLPALPQMAQDLKVDDAAIRLTLTFYTIGMAFGQLIIGTLSDRFGRRRLMIGGGLAVAISALSVSRSEDLNSLLLSCLILGLGSAAGLVTGRAVISDRSTGKESTKYFSLLQMAVSAGPIVAPLAGSALLEIDDWRLIFTSLAAFAVVGSLAAILFVDESLPAELRKSTSPAKAFLQMVEILKNRKFFTFALTIWLGFGMLFGYISTSTFIFQDLLGTSASTFAIIFSINGLGLVSASLTSARLSKSHPAERIIAFGVAIQVLAMLALGISYWTNTYSFASVVGCFFILVSSMGFVLGPSTSLALTEVRHAGGTALALVGSLQFATGGTSAYIIGQVSPEPLQGFVFIGGFATIGMAIAVISGYRLVKREKRETLWKP